MSTPSGIASGLKQRTTQNKSGSNGTNFTDILKLALVLDDSYLVNRDLAKCVMGEVMIELNSSKSKSKFIERVRVASWFRSLCNAQPDFTAKERIVWVDIKGVPLNAWSRSTFQKIGSKWGELVDLEDVYEDLFARKRICVMTSHMENILESFKLIVKGKVFWARAKELFVWSPSFKEVPKRELFPDDEPIKANEDANNLNLGDAENNSEVVSDTYFGDNGEDQGVDQHQAEPSKVQEVLDDPFNIYGLLNKCNKEVRTSDSSSSIPYPPGFTPINDIPTGIQDNPVVSSARSPSKSARRNSSPCQSNGLSSRVMEDMVPADIYTSPVGSKSKHGSHKGGSMLEVLDSMIKVGLGSKAKKDWISELNHKHKVSFLTLQETKMECISAMEAKIVWGNSSFDHVFSEALGNSGGILCLWDPLMFRKDHHIISDNFVVIYGTWVPNNAKLLIVTVYAPQSAADKCLLWSYITGLLSRWKGEVLVNGDFLKSTWNLFVLEDSNGMVRLIDIQDKLSNIDHTLDQGGAADEILLPRMELMKQMHDIKSTVAREQIQKAKIQWALEGDENSKFFHGVVNHKRVQLSVKGVMIDGEWVDEPDRVKEEFRFHFANRFQDKGSSRCRLNFRFPSLLSADQISDLKKPVSYDEIRKAVWSCRENKSPGPDGFTFELFRKFWDSIGPNMCVARSWIKGSLTSSMASVLVNGSPTSKFQFHCGLKQGDPLAPYLFILIMESLHLLVSRAVEAGIFFGVGVNDSLVNEAAGSIGCSVMKAPFKYLGVMVGNSMSKISAWDEMVGKIKSRLSKWKVNNLSIGGRLMLLKAVLGSTIINPMSLYKVLKFVLHEMESSRRNFFNGAQGVDRKISWVWRFLSHENSLWFRFISAMHDSSIQPRSSSYCSNWLSILREVSSLKLQGIDFLSHCKRRVGSGMQTRFWEDLWLGETPFRELFPRGGVESQQLEIIKDLVRLMVLSNVDDRWAWDLNGDGDFCIKDARDLMDEVLLPKENVATRWIKTIPIKVNVFAWKLRLDRLPTRSNLFKRGVQLQLFLGVYVDSGTFLGAQLILIWAGWSGLLPFEWDISLKGS
uniref:RNA-directed DNA polymerase, eukaryota n=1 Tax=Tanacetum cinerariifolium TaxID=118510 RepID=A0A699IJQ7_TANCI|nr:hypothetical protein [Tanacetum cinerariifolium]